MRIVILSFVACLALVWGAAQLTAAQAEANGHAAASAEFDAGVAPIAADPAPPATVTADSTPEEIAETAWRAMRAGYVGPAVLLFVFLAGVQAQKKKGYIIKRWPRLNDGRAWAAVAIVTSTAVTLVPLAIAEIGGADPNALTARAVFSAAGSSLFLWLRSHLSPVETTTPAATA
jgi:hypothetical protein